ncbi:MAG: hypothetical protein ABI577_17250 [bacterium]
MARWSDLEREAPEVAAGGRELFYQHGVGLAYLATARRDDGLRIHPFCPVVTAGGIFGLIGQSPKRADLASSGRFAIHAFPREEADDEFMLSGMAVRRLDDPAEIAAVAEVYHAAGATSSGEEWTFEFLLDRALLSLYERRDSGKPLWPPRYLKWQAR